MQPPGGSDERRRTFRYVPALDGLRGVAIALVVSYHAFGWPARGFLGVHLFFVLSGFLITTLLLQEWHRRGTISLQGFYRRRALRLLPGLAALLVAYTGLHLVRTVAGGAEHDLATALKAVAYSAFYVTNVVQAAGVVLPVPLDHLWSLAAEEQFYLLWPFLLVLALRFRVRAGLVEAALVGAIALVALERVRLGLEDASFARLYYGPDTTFDPILIGCLLGLWFVLDRAPRPLREDSTVRWLVPPALALAAVPVVVLGPGWEPIQWSWVLPFGLASGLVLWAVVTERAPALERLLAVRPLVALGRISYSLYLWHLLVLWTGERQLGIPPAIGLALAIAVAAASYRFVERPFLRRKRRERAELESRPTDRAEWGRDQPVPLRAGAID
jgi:peptidoglycan/LPS O-acetylase OafA/YrhL